MGSSNTSCDQETHCNVSDVLHFLCATKGKELIGLMNHVLPLSLWVSNGINLDVHDVQMKRFPDETLRDAILRLAHGRVTWIAARTLLNGKSLSSPELTERYMYQQP